MHQQYQANNNNILIDLEDKQLWTKFYHITNEMILTKAGRRTFPLIKLRLDNLEDSALYTVQIEFRVADSFKYRFVNGEWRTTPRTEKLPNTPTLYTHSDSPNFGHHWTKDTIQFFKLKLTNNENGKNRDAVYLRSLNKYDPIIHIYKHDRKNVDDKILVFSHSFKETQFVAVTAYQNDMITKLKVNYNPYAKAFKNTGNHVITIENDKVITTSFVENKEEKLEEKKQVPKLEYSIANMTQQSQTKTEPNQYQQSLTAYNNNMLSVNPSSYSQQDILNWYAPRYQLDTNTQQQQQQQQLYQTQPQFNPHPYKPYSTTEPYNTAPSLYGFDYASSQHLNNPYFYQQRLYANQFSYYQQSQQQQQEQQYQSNDSSLAFDSSSSYSPSNEYYSKSNNTSSAKRIQMKENRHAPYSTSRPAKRASNNDSSLDNLTLPISPVYSSTETANTNYNNNNNKANINSKLEFNENSSDDSYNSTELNYLNQLNHVTTAPIQSSISSVSSSYSTASNKTTNESGYYSHSPTSIALILDSAQQENNSD